MKNGATVDENLVSIIANIGEKIIYNSSQFSFFELKKDSVSYGINIDF